MPIDENIMRADDDKQLILLQWSYCERYKYINACVFMRVYMYVWCVCVCVHICVNTCVVCTYMHVYVCVRDVPILCNNF